MRFVDVRKTGLRVNEARAICFRTRLFCREWQKSIDPRELNSAHLSDITGSRKQRWIYSTAGPPKCPIPSHCLKQVDTVVVRRTVPLSCVVLISYIPACPAAKTPPETNQEIGYRNITRPAAKIIMWTWGEKMSAHPLILCSKLFTIWTSTRVINRMWCV